MKYIISLFIVIYSVSAHAQSPVSPEQLKFVRQGVKRMIFDDDQSIPLASLVPGKIIGLTAMHPISEYSDTHSEISISKDKLLIQSEGESQTGFGLAALIHLPLIRLIWLPVKGKGN